MSEQRCKYISCRWSWCSWKPRTYQKTWKYHDLNTKKNFYQFLQILEIYYGQLDSPIGAFRLRTLNGAMDVRKWGFLKKDVSIRSRTVILMILLPKTWLLAGFLVSNGLLNLVYHEDRVDEKIVFAETIFCMAGAQKTVFVFFMGNGLFVRCEQKDRFFALKRSLHIHSTLTPRPIPPSWEVVSRTRSFVASLKPTRQFSSCSKHWIR